MQTIKEGLRFGEWSLIEKIRKHFFKFFDGQDLHLFCVACLKIQIFFSALKLMKGKRKRKKVKTQKDT